MSVATPTERAYYYECSAGKLRLTLFMPPNILAEMADRGDVAGEVLEDFPDGIDLSCTEPDFRDFKSVYDYRPPFNADQLRAAFLAMFSKTRDWESFRGTGFVRADELEQNATALQQELEQADLAPPAMGTAPTELVKRREWVQAKVTQESKATDWLKEVSVPGVDPSKSIQQQSFSAVKMEGRPAEDVFLHLHRKRGSE